MLTIKVTNNLDEVIKELPKGMEEVVKDTAEHVRDDIREEMAKPKHGRAYPGYVASAPGEVPGIQPFPLYPTGGQLYASIAADQDGAFSWVVWTGVDYAHYLEYGTSKMAPRPFMRPAARKAALQARIETKELAVELEHI